MNWHERYKQMKAGLGYTNSDIAEITGNTPDSIKSSTQPNIEIPRWLKLAIVVYECKLTDVEAKNLFKEKDKDSIMNFIRKRLSFDEGLFSQLRYVDTALMAKEHRRFDMGGYESHIVSNLAILNKFADLGIYSYTEYLTLTFYKGTPTLRLQYLGAKNSIIVELDGYGTTEIIYEVFEKTIFSGMPSRRW